LKGNEESASFVYPVSLRDLVLNCTAKIRLFGKIAKKITTYWSIVPSFMKFFPYP